MVVVVRLWGGMGNQLFQYATGLSLATYHGTELRLDTSFLEVYRKDMVLRLSPFCIDEEFASRDDISAFPGARGDFVGRARYFAQRALKPYYRCSILFEKRYSFDPNVFKTPKHVYLVGHWQSERYFSRIRDILLKKLELKEEMSPESRKVANMISRTRAISVHIRRGDFASDPETNQFHGTCSLEYYENCARLVREKIPDSHFFVFSDEPDWGMRNLKIGDEATFVASNGESRPHEDLKLMSMCEGHILANSSFSWWGAWLNPNPDKVVLAPRMWFNRAPIDTRDLIPDGWIRV